MAEPGLEPATPGFAVRLAPDYARRPGFNNCITCMFFILYKIYVYFDIQKDQNTPMCVIFCRVQLLSRLACVLFYGISVLSESNLVHSGKNIAISSWCFVCEPLSR